MNFFLDDAKIESQFKEIFTRIRPLMNGVVHQDMRNYGLNYPKSMGASVVSLRKLASCYEPNHLLAHKLWVKGFRETRIIASLLEVPEEVTFDQLERWMQDVEAVELVEHLSMNLLCRVPGILELMQEWIASDRELYRCAALLVAGRLALVDNDIEDSSFVKVLDKLPEDNCKGYFQKCLQRNLGKIARRSDKLRELVVDSVSTKMSGETGWNQVASQLFYELDIEF